MSSMPTVKAPPNTSKVMVLKVGAMHGPPKRKVGVAGKGRSGKMVEPWNVQGFFCCLDMRYCRCILVVYDMSMMDDLDNLYQIGNTLIHAYI